MMNKDGVMALEHMRDVLDQAYRVKEIGWCTPEPESKVAAFERAHQVLLPATYRWLLIAYGSADFGEPFLYGIDELEWAYPAFLVDYQAYQDGYEMPQMDPFPIGGFGDGSTAILDQQKGRVWMLLHDAYEDVPLKEVFPSFAALMQTLSQQVLWVQQQTDGDLDD